jgi:hypothetical protein
MAIVKASEGSREAQDMPSDKDDRLTGSQGKRVRFSGVERTIIDGPFTETKEFVAGRGSQASNACGGGA